MEKVDVEPKGSYLFQFVFIWGKKKKKRPGSINSTVFGKISL